MPNATPLILLFFCLLSGCSSVLLQENFSTCLVKITVSDQCLHLVNKHANFSNVFTQGLAIHDGVLYQSSGGYGKSFVQRYDIENKKLLIRRPLSEQYFAEGLSWHNQILYLLSWREQTAWALDRETLQPFKQFRYQGEGWGLTSNDSELILSNGSSMLSIIDASNFNTIRTLNVYERIGASQKHIDNINELEWVEGRIWANVWQTDRIIIIHPITGEVEKSIDLSALVNRERNIHKSAGVLNGIAYDSKQHRVYLSGKNWQHIYTFLWDPMNTVK